MGTPSVFLLDGDQTALISLSMPESAVYVGNPFAGVAQDWRIGVQGMSAGQSFSLSVSAVPEASTLALALAGLALLITRRAQARSGAGKGCKGGMVAAIN